MIVKGNYYRREEIKLWQKMKVLGITVLLIQVTAEFSVILFVEKVD
jgi:hypothetical protein